MPEPAPRYEGIRAPLRPSANGSARPPPASPARRQPAGAPSAIPTGLLPARIIFDAALPRHGATDGGWWPRSRNALIELPALIAALDARPGVRVQRLAIHHDEWDEIPHQLTADGSHFVRVVWFTTIPRHTVSVTAAGGREPIALLVVPPDTPTETAWAEMNIAATNPGTPQTADILTVKELQARKRVPETRKADFRPGGGVTLRPNDKYT